MKRIISSQNVSSSIDYKETLFVSPDDEDIYSSLVRYIYAVRWNVEHSTRMYIYRLHTYAVNGFFQGYQDGVNYVVMKEGKKQKVLTEKYFLSKYVAIDKAGLQQYEDIYDEFFNSFGHINVPDSEEAIQAWLDENNISDFSILV